MWIVAPIIVFVVFYTLIKEDEDSLENKEQRFRDYMDDRENGRIP